MISTIDKVKNLIFLDVEPSANQLRLLDTIYDITNQRILSILPPIISEVPSELEYILIELIIKRYNRIGSEGMSSETVDGHKMDFVTDSDINEYLGDIEDWIDANLDLEKEGKNILRFL